MYGESDQGANGHLGFAWCSEKNTSSIYGSFFSRARPEPGKEG